MYFGLSFSRVGCNFQTLMIPIFTKAIANTFRQNISKATKAYAKNMERFTLINKTHPNIPWKTKNNDPIQPPDSLLEFYPLAEYLNQVLTSFNTLRLCPPIALVNDIVKDLQESLQFVSGAILTLYKQEHQAFTMNSKEAFTRLCVCFADELVPYIQKCIHVVYPPNNLASQIGVNAQSLLDESVTVLDRDAIVRPISHLLPKKIDPFVSGDVSGEGAEIDVTVENVGEKVQCSVDTNL